MIGIHDCPGSFSDRWIQYCEEHDVHFRRVDCLASDVVAQCAGLDAVLWNWSHFNPAEQFVARQIIASLEATGLLVFPSTKTCWHFDDKIAQKYLLEAIKAPLIPTWVFTSQAEALRWCGSAAWPKVFKLRRGAGSANVRLVRSQEEAVALCRQAFGRGFPAVAPYLADVPSRLRNIRSARDFRQKLKSAPRTLVERVALRRQVARERGYVYFQEFLAGNDGDTRVTIIGNRAFGFTRANRLGDFRASGSGSIEHDPATLDTRCVEIAFEVTDRLGAQSLAFDFLFGPRREPMIGEISYSYMASAVHACPGHWNREGAWIPGHVWPEHAILEDVLAACRR